MCKKKGKKIKKIISIVCNNDNNNIEEIIIIIVHFQKRKLFSYLSCFTNILNDQQIIKTAVQSMFYLPIKKNDNAPT